MAKLDLGDCGLEQWVERQCGHLLGESSVEELDAIVAKIRVAARSPGVEEAGEDNG